MYSAIMQVATYSTPVCVAMYTNSGNFGSFFGRKQKIKIGGFEFGGE